MTGGKDPMTERLRRYIVLKVAAWVYDSESAMSLIRGWQERDAELDLMEWEHQREQDLRNEEIIEALGGKNPDDGFPWE
jgi:hypothetical protein